MRNFLILLIFVPLSLSAQILNKLSGPFPDDDFMALLNPLGPTYNIFHLDRLHLTKGAALFEPWASSYWPIHRGVLAFRYSQREKYNSKKFIDNYNSFSSYSAIDLINSGKTNELSPAEKYDLLVGDRNWTLTKAMWKKGYDDYEKHGVVAQWTGICHGWSAIAHQEVLPPKKTVVLLDVTGSHSIQFYESDIKGLLSYLWAESPPETKQAGNRCYQVPVTRDPNLRPIEASCLDTNPMTWHLSIANRVGRYQKGFVMDSSIGAEVWNYPITSYDYSYFNARTLEPTHSLKHAIVPIEHLTNDRFSTVRNLKTKYVMGIIMDVFHPALIEPTNGNSGNTFQTHTFIYDLELDENYDVIGGEWYSEEQPDFLWTFAPESRARVREDLTDMSPWDGTWAIPSDIAEKAIQASQRGKVMATIVDILHKKSLE